MSGARRMSRTPLETQNKNSGLQISTEALTRYYQRRMFLIFPPEYTKALENPEIVCFYQPDMDYSFFQNRTYTSLKETLAQKGCSFLLLEPIREKGRGCLHQF